jgi:hypothetical protein
MKAIERTSAVRRFLPAMALTVLALASQAQAQQGSFGKEIEGTWNLVSNFNEQDGKKVAIFGDNPKGVVIFSGGRFSFVMMKAGLPAFASNNRTKGTPEENQAVVQGSIAYFGTYSVLSEKDKTVTLHIEGSTLPNWDGQEQKRVISVTGEKMNLVNPFASVGGTNYVALTRAK